MAITVDNDPEAINAYRRKIQEAIKQLNDQLHNTERAVERVSESWKDNNFMEFQTSFNEDKEQIRPLCSVLDNYESNILYQLEQKLRTYIGGPTHL